MLQACRPCRALAANERDARNAKRRNSHWQELFSCVAIVAICRQTILHGESLIYELLNIRIDGRTQRILPHAHPELDAQIADRILDGKLRREAKNVKNLVGIDAIGARVGAWLRLDRWSGIQLLLFLIHHIRNQFRDVGHLHVLRADVEYLARDFVLRRFEQQLVAFRHVLDVQVRALLLAAEYRDLVFQDRVCRDDVYRQVKTHPGGITANRSRPDDRANEIRRLMLEQYRLARGLVFIVKRDGEQRMFFRDVWRVRYAVDAA